MIKMRKIKNSCLLFLLPVCLLSCSQDEQVHAPTGPIPAAFTITMDAPSASTRMETSLRHVAARAGDTWAGVGTIGILPSNASTFYQHTPAGTGTSVALNPINEANTIYYPLDGSSLTFTAFGPYPKSADISAGFVTAVVDNKVTYGLYEAQEYNTVNNMSKVDFIYHTGTTSYNHASPLAPLNFKHGLSRVIINLYRGGNYSGSLKGTGLDIANVPGRVVCNVLTGEITTPNDKGLVTLVCPFRTIDKDDNVRYEAIVAPQDNSTYVKASERELCFYIEGDQAIIIPQIYEAGYSYEYDFIFDQTGVKFAGCTITPWNTVPGTEQPGSVTGGFPTGWDDEVDWSIALFEGESNCYIVPTDGQVVIPISRAKAFANTEHGADHPVLEPDEIFYATYYWMDAENVLSDTKPVVPLGFGPNGYLLVNTGADQGNAVVAVQKKDGDELITLWSWHIWVVDDYDPKAVTYTNNGYTFMDRNLGATSTEKGSVYALGNYYQWGRKDPFVRAGAIDDNDIEIPVYTPDGIYIPFGSERTGDDFVRSDGDVAVAMITSIQNPKMLYNLVQGTPVWDWCTDDASRTSDRWGAQSAKNTLYVPCPAGWRVPLQTAFVGFDTEWEHDSGWVYDFAWDNINRGCYSDDLGWWPAVGLRWGDYDGGVLNYVGVEGCYWSAAPHPDNDGQACSLHFHDGYVDPFGNYTRYNGMSVRCVADK